MNVHSEAGTKYSKLSKLWNDQYVVSREGPVEGMDDVLTLYRDLFEVTEKSSPSGGDQRELTVEEAQMRLGEGFALIDPGELFPGPALKRAPKIADAIVAQ